MLSAMGAIVSVADTCAAGLTRVPKKFRGILPQRPKQELCIFAGNMVSRFAGLVTGMHSAFPVLRPGAVDGERYRSNRRLRGRHPSASHSGNVAGVSERCIRAT